MLELQSRVYAFNTRYQLGCRFSQYGDTIMNVRIYEQYANDKFITND